MPELSVVALGAIAVVAALLLLMLLYARNYIKVPPNEVAVFTGRGRVRTVRGGARFRVPVVERVDKMMLEPFNVTVAVTNIYSVDGVPVNVDGVGLIKFGSSDEALSTAVERFLTSNRNELHNQVQEILAGNMRGIVAQMTVEELNNNREEFRRRVVEDAGSDFKTIGMELDVLTIQNISDPSGYLEALGRKRIAEVHRDAEIGEAEAQRDSRIRSAEANREGQTAQAVADTAIAQANRERDLELARIQALIQAEQARASQAGPQAEAEAHKAVVVAEAAAQAAQTEAQIEVERLRGQRAQEAQQADVVIPAEAAKQAALLQAAAEKATAIAEAEAVAEARRLGGIAEAEARKAAAEAHQTELEAAAAGERARLLAEAEGQEKMAVALSAFNEQAARLSVLPRLIEALPQMAAEVAKPMGNIDNITVIGGGSENGTAGFADTVPLMLARTFASLKSAGLDLGDYFGTKTEDEPVATEPEEVVPVVVTHG
ncbi:MAG TPA: SPFH domain-containing protein [Nitrososphaera sp.]|nr:SPFH domain-containing protein [Nitrososphaera sp.]